MMGYYGYDHMSGWGLMGFFFMATFWVLVIALVIWLARSGSGLNTDGPTDNAMEALRERYAKGEMSKEEFEAKKKDLLH